MNPRDEPDLVANRISRLTLPGIVGPAIVGATFAAMLAWTWFKWPDPLIDFGRELYLAWQVAEGKTLYRDVEHFNGPLSVHFNALLFRLFAPSIQTLAYANIALAAGTVSLLYAIVRRFAGTFAASTCGVMFATLFACVQFVDTGNYNFITPYSHEVTHGLLLVLAAVWCFVQFVETGKLTFAIATGASLGLLWLTKFELFLAGAAAVGVGVALLNTVARRRVTVTPTFKVSACIVGAILAVITIAFLLLLINLPPADAARGVMGSSFYVFDARLTSLPFYRKVAGLDDIGGNLLAMFVSAATLACLLGLRRLEAMIASRSQSVRPALFLLAAIPPLIAWLSWPAIPWHLALRGLPLVVAGILIHRFATTRRDRSPGDVAALVFLTAALVLPAKIILATQLQHYGFSLALPAMLVVVATLVRLPERSIAAEAQRRPGEASTLQDFATSVPLRCRPSWFGLSAVLTFIAVHLFVYSRLFSQKPISVGSDGNAFFAAAGVPGQASRGESLAALLANIDAFVPPAATLAAVPEGAMVNFLTGRANPTPFITLQPPEYLMFGADRITRAYQQSPPDFVVINLTVDPAEYGSRGFDQDYGKALADFIKQNYAPVWRDPAGGRLLLLRKK